MKKWKIYLLTVLAMLTALLPMIAVAQESYQVKSEEKVEGGKEIPAGIYKVTPMKAGNNFYYTMRDYLGNVIFYCSEDPNEIPYFYISLEDGFTFDGTTAKKTGYFQLEPAEEMGMAPDHYEGVVDGVNLSQAILEAKDRIGRGTELGSMTYMNMETFAMGDVIYHDLTDAPSISFDAKKKAFVFTLIYWDDTSTYREEAEQILPILNTCCAMQNPDIRGCRQDDDGGYSDYGGIYDEYDTILQVLTFKQALSNKKGESYLIPAGTHVEDAQKIK